jgi:exonuclease III
MTGNNRHLLILALNINAINAPIKSQRIANWVKKQDSTICCLRDTHLFEKNEHWLRVTGRKQFFQGNAHNKEVGVAILISEKVDFRLKSIGRLNERHLMLIKGTVHQEEISILNIYAPNKEAPIYIKKKKRKTQMDLRQTVTQW